MPRANLPKKFLFGIILLIGLAAGLPLVLSQSQVQQILTGKAWYTSQSSSAVCSPTSTNALITVSFTNQESNPSLGMLVKVVDTQTGKSVDLGTINSGATKTGQIDTGRTSLNSGYVTFNLAWSNGYSGTDSRTAGYSQVVNCAPPTPTPTPSPIIPTPTTKPAPTSTPIPTPTPTTKPTPTPSPVPSASPTPTTCPTPGTVKNIKIQCPYCTPSPIIFKTQ